MSKNEVRVGFKDLTGNGLQKMDLLADRLDKLENNVNGAWKNAPLGSDLGFGRSVTAPVRAANYSLAQPIQKLSTLTQKLSTLTQKLATLESQLKSISALGTLQDRLDDIQNDLSKRHDLTKPLGAANFCTAELNRASLAARELKDFEDRYNLTKTTPLNEISARLKDIRN